MAGQESDRSPEGEPVWSYRGYQLHAGEFTTAMVHLFRAEINRANVWRTRLDSTTNWALVTTAAAISFAFSGPAGHHLVLPLSALIATILLYIESRRYRYYELWSYRVRLMETDFFASMLVPPFKPGSDWSEAMADSLLHPQFTITLWEALGRRLRRNYIWIFLVLVLGWLAKIWIYPTTAGSWYELFSRAAIGHVPGWLTLGVGMAYFVLLLIFALITSGLRQASGEILPRYGETEPTHTSAETGPGHTLAWYRPSHRRRQFLCLVISDRAEEVSQQILDQMQRGVTALQGTGMYSKKGHAVLLSALTVTEVPHLKHLVSEVDPDAFVVVSPAQEVLGRGFDPLPV